MSMPMLGQEPMQLPAAEPQQPPPPPPADEFWAKKQASELVQAIKDKEARYFQAAERRGIKAMWEIAYAQYFGTESMNPGELGTQVTSRTGPQGKFIRFRINEYRSLVGQQNIIAIGERPAFQSLALNSDYESGSQVEIADDAISYLYTKAAGERRERQVVEADRVSGVGYGHVQWDFEGGDDVPVMTDVPGQFLEDGSPAQLPQERKSGAPYVTVAYPWEVVQDPGSRELNWAIVRERCSKWELAAEYPEYADLITKTNVLDEFAIEHIFGFDIDQANSDDTLVKHFYHPRCAAIPEGRYVGLCGDAVLWDEPCPVAEGIPVAELCSGKYFCSAFGYADSWDLIAVQEMLDQMASDTATNLSVFGRQILFYDKGSEFSFDKIAEGILGFGKTPGSDPPQAVNYAAMPEGVKWFIEYLHERHQSLSGLNSVARGDPKANIKSGEMAALFHSIAIEFQSACQAALDEYRVRVANLMLDMLRQYADAPFLVEVAGADQRPYLKEFTSQSFAAVKRVTMTTVSPMMRSTSGRLDVFMKLKDVAPEERAAAYQLITTGQAKGFTEKMRSSELRIEWENEQLQQGKQCQVLFTDDPWEHVPDHKASLEKLTSSFNDEQPDPVVMAAIQAHTQHIIQHAVVYQSLDPRVAAFLNIPPPPPVPNSPAAQLAMETGMVGIPQPQPANTNSSAGPGGSPPPGSSGGQANTGAPPRPQMRDTTGTKLPNPSKPPANSNLQPGAAE